MVEIAAKGVDSHDFVGPFAWSSAIGYALANYGLAAYRCVCSD